MSTPCAAPAAIAAPRAVVSGMVGRTGKTKTKGTQKQSLNNKYNKQQHHLYVDVIKETDNRLLHVPPGGEVKVHPESIHSVCFVHILLCLLCYVFPQNPTHNTP